MPASGLRVGRGGIQLLHGSPPGLFLWTHSERVIGCIRCLLRSVCTFPLSTPSEGVGFSAVFATLSEGVREYIRGLPRSVALSRFLPLRKESGFRPFSLLLPKESRENVRTSGMWHGVLSGCPGHRGGNLRAAVTDSRCQ